MNVLVVAALGSTYGGTAHRLALAVSALATLGDVHLFVVTNDPGDGPIPGSADAMRTAVVGRRRPSVAVQAVRWVSSGLPGHLGRLDLDDAVDALRAFVRRPPDLTWLCKPDALLLAQRAGLLGSSVVWDLDDLDDVRIRSISRLRSAAIASPPELSGPSGHVRRIAGAVDARRWTAFVRRGASTTHPVLCSDLECRRSHLARASVVPNGYAAPSNAVSVARDAELVVVVGSFHYLPNLDGARWVAAAIAPELRRLRPSAEIRLVGAGPPELRSIGSRDGVTWAGPVTDVAAAVRRASVALVPLRAGSGTRVKIVEAWALGIPVVATTVGAEGLEVQHGVDALVADDAAGLAAAVDRVLTDERLRASLVEHGRRRWREAHSPAAVGEAVKKVVDKVLQPTGDP